MDPRLTWKEHIAHATRKGLAASEALAKLATSTWGPSVRATRLIYTAVVRPTLLYAAQEWSMRSGSGTQAKHNLRKIAVIQNRCLRRVLGAYQRTLTAALERESVIPPIAEYIEIKTLTNAARTTNH